MKISTFKKDNLEIEQARHNFYRWNQELLSKNPAQVAELYAPDATFLPTRHWGLEIGNAGAERYFRHFLKLDPEGKIVRDDTIMLGSDCYLHYGNYDFTVGLKNNRKIVNACFTFAWKINNFNEWKIIHHHSSRKERAGVDDYYLHFFVNGKNIKIIHKEFQTLAPNYYMETGLFSFEDSLYEYKLTIPARFTMVWQKISQNQVDLVYYHLSEKPD